MKYMLFNVFKMVKASYSCDEESDNSLIRSPVTKYYTSGCSTSTFILNQHKSEQFVDPNVTDIDFQNSLIWNMSIHGNTYVVDVVDVVIDLRLKIKYGKSIRRMLRTFDQPLGADVFDYIEQFIIYNYMNSASEEGNIAVDHRPSRFERWIWWVDYEYSLKCDYKMKKTHSRVEVDKNDASRRKVERFCNKEGIKDKLNGATNKYAYNVVVDPIH
ncbi:hypothetical protein ECANGB1_670 [Enterospora canceri]|uniref:Uncharacterized protein n=1 Tax=Enterospora canceri TaxID=1081671 RepID=A0A1Y1S7N7_9MICR|nr:hypothetical protein ECANGB1_670 [Enterospora canceri]